MDMETRLTMDWRPVLGALMMAMGTGICLAQCEADLNQNQTVDNDDLMMLLSQYGLECDEAPWYDPVISEIHYNPSSMQGNDSEYEFVEVMNPHPFSIDLSGWSLADGVDATFPAGTILPSGGFLLTANDTSTYRDMLGAFVPMIQWTSTSSLHNSGETLRILRPDGSEADEVSYSDTNGWTDEADGLGSSLEWLGGIWDNAQPSSWVGSNALGGSPGSDNSTWAD